MGNWIKVPSAQFRNVENIKEDQYSLQSKFQMQQISI